MADVTIAAASGTFAGDRPSVDQDFTAASDTLTRTALNGAAETVISGDVIEAFDGTAGGAPIPTVRGGNDRINGASGGAPGERLVGDADIMYGGILWGGSDTIYGLAGDDFITGDVHIALEGNQSLPVIHGGNDTLDGGEGNDFVVGDVSFPNPATVYGGNDTLYGGDGDDALLGDQQNLRGDRAAECHIIGGNDKLYAGKGDDILVGGGGDDILDGGDGIDSLGYNQLAFDAAGNLTTAGITVRLGEAGQWGTATGSHGNDSILNVENVLASLGNDFVYGNSGANTLNGSFAGDTLFAYGGNDTVIGEDGNDTLYGGTGSDLVDGGKGNDRLFGGIGNDRLVDIDAKSKAEYDVLSGGLGNDTFISGRIGARSMLGGTGADRFLPGGGTTYITPGSGRDTIVAPTAAKLGDDAFIHVYGFSLQEDRIDLRALNLTQAALERAMDDWAAGAALELNLKGANDLTILLHGIDSDGLKASNFIL